VGTGGVEDRLIGEEGARNGGEEAFLGVGEDRCNVGEVGGGEGSGRLENPSPPCFGLEVGKTVVSCGYSS
jgi:hypothetical protein